MSPRRTKRKKPLPVLSMTKALSSKFGRKLTVAQIDWMLDLFAQGESPARVHQRLHEQGAYISKAAVAAYLARRKDEIAQRKKLWSDGYLKRSHLRYAGGRLQELERLYAVALRDAYKVRCAECSGKGAIGPRDKETKCKLCKGKGWRISDDIPEAYTLGDDVGTSVLRLLVAPPPPGMDGPVWDRLVAILREIRTEVGDTKPEKEGSGDDAVAKERAAALQALTAKLLQMTSEQVIGLYARVGRGQEGRALTDGGSGGGTEDGANSCVSRES